MLKIAIILGSTRPGRRGEQVAQWVLQQAVGRGDAEYEIVDLRDHPLPHLDEPVQPAQNRYSHEHTKAWSRTIDPYDGFIFVTPEYNHGVPGVLKNAIDYLYHEWNSKAATFVGYGAVGGARAIQQLRLIASGVDMATTRADVALSVFTDFEEDRITFAPTEFSHRALHHALERVGEWSGALRELRLSKSAPAV